MARDARIEPVPVAERAELIDALRGFALAGVLVVNAPMYFAPLRQTALPDADATTLDRVVSALVTFLAQGKFYALFSFLFGVGASIQLARAEGRGPAFGRFFARRLTGLAALGLAHALGIWYGDILFLYALVGFALIPFARRATRTAAIWSAGLLAAPVVLSAAAVGSLTLVRLVPDAGAELDAVFAAARIEIAEAALRTEQAYAVGPFGALFAARAEEWATVLGYGALTFVPGIAGLFLLGFAIGRTRPWARVDELAPRMRRALAWLLPAGLAGATVQTATSLAADPVAVTPIDLAQSAATFLGAPALGLAYAAGLALAWRDPIWRRRLAILVPAGRMALTNYLAQSLVLTTAAYHYGLGLYGRVTPSAALVLAAGLFAIQIVVSRLWLARHRYGPVEWLWRSWTYGRLQNLRRG